MSCDREPSEPTWYLEQETKDYCFFKKGSWWVYEETESGDVDSVFCSLDTSGISDPDNTFDVFVEWFSIDLQSSYYSTRMSMSSEACPESYEDVYDIIFYHTSGNPTLSLIYFDPTNYKEAPCNLSNLKTIHLDDYKDYIGFEQVRIFEYHESGVPTLPIIPKRTFWVKNIGIVKKIMPDGKEWNLIRSNILQ